MGDFLSTPIKDKESEDNENKDVSKLKNKISFIIIYFN
jgi:hypothetical protein